MEELTAMRNDLMGRLRDAMDKAINFSQEFLEYSNLWTDDRQACVVLSLFIAGFCRNIISDYNFKTSWLNLMSTYFMLPCHEIWMSNSVMSSHANSMNCKNCKLVT